jgi:hypothetical protein
VNQVPSTPGRSHHPGHFLQSQATLQRVQFHLESFHFSSPMQHNAAPCTPFRHMAQRPLRGATGQFNFQVRSTAAMTSRSASTRPRSSATMAWRYCHCATPTWDAVQWHPLRGAPLTPPVAQLATRRRAA